MQSQRSFFFPGGCLDPWKISTPPPPPTTLLPLTMLDSSKNTTINWERSLEPAFDAFLEELSWNIPSGDTSVRLMYWFKRFLQIVNKKTAKKVFSSKKRTVPRPGIFQTSCESSEFESGTGLQNFSQTLSKWAISAPVNGISNPCNSVQQVTRIGNLHVGLICLQLVDSFAFFFLMSMLNKLGPDSGLKNLRPTSK